MLLKLIARNIGRSSMRNVRECSYKPIKRPDFSATSKKVFVDKKLKEFDLQKILQAKIQMSGPITGEHYCEKTKKVLMEC